jgi:MFS family permease
VPGAVRRLLVGHALASVAMSLPWPLLLVLVHARGGPAVLVGLTAAARMLPYVLLSWAAGSLADRFRRDTVLRVTLLARLVCLAVVAAAVAGDQLLLAVLAASAAIASGTPAYPALAAAMPSVAGLRRRRATDLLVTVEVASFVVGPAVGGLLLVPALRGLVPLLAVVGTTLALAVVTGVRLGRPTGATTVGPGLARVVRLPAVVGCLVVLALLNAVDAALALTLLPLAERAWTSGDSGFGLATSLLGFGALAAPLLWRLGRSAAGRARCGLLVVAGGLLLLPTVPGLLWALPLLATVGAASVHVESAVTEQVQDTVADGQRAGVLGAADSVMVGAALVGAVVSPWLGDLLGPTLTLVLLAALALAALPFSRSRVVATAPAAPPVLPTQRRAAAAESIGPRRVG